MSLGCNKTDVETGQLPEKPGKVTEAATTNVETNSVATSQMADATSPAADSNKVAVDATAKDVCEQFMQNLQSGNRIAAENLLTRVALMNTSKEGLVLEPMGGPNSKCNFGEVRYATNKQKLAQVDCTVVDSVDGCLLYTSPSPRDS